MSVIQLFEWADALGVNPCLILTEASGSQPDDSIVDQAAILDTDGRVLLGETARVLPALDETARDTFRYLLGLWAREAGAPAPRG